MNVMKHLLLVHGVNADRDDDAFKSYVYEQLAPHIQNFDIIVLNSRHSNIYAMIEGYIDSGETSIRITPLTFFSTYEQHEVLPEVITTFNHTHPWVTISVAYPFSKQKFLKEILTEQLAQLATDKDMVAFIGLGYNQLKLPNDELAHFVSTFDEDGMNVKGFMLNGAMDYKELLPNAIRRYNKLIVVPLFFMPEIMFNEMNDNLKRLTINKKLHVIPSLTTSTALKNMVINDIQRYENSRLYI